jgi:hypothetical protein
VVPELFFDRHRERYGGFLAFRDPPDFLDPLISSGEQAETLCRLSGHGHLLSTCMTCKTCMCFPLIQFHSTLLRVAERHTVHTGHAARRSAMRMTALLANVFALDSEHR